MRESLQDFCIREGWQELLDQWVADKNLPITPAVISRGSKRKVWWRCEKGHNWQAAVYTRTGSGTGCPVCAGKVAQAGENDLAARFPELAHQWHPIRNSCLAPTQVLPGSHRTVWWMCKEGHEWRAQIKSRVSGSGCPVCANREIHPARTIWPPNIRSFPPNGTPPIRGICEMGKSLTAFCRRENLPDLLAQWDGQANLPRHLRE